MVHRRNNARAWLVMALAAIGFGLVVGAAHGLPWVAPMTSASAQAVNVGPNASAIALDPRRGRAFVTSDGSAPDISVGHVSVLDIHSRALVQTTPVGRGVHTIVADPLDRRIFVINATHSGANSVDVLDADSGAILRSIPIQGVAASAAADVQRKRRHLFVSATMGNTVSMYDTRTGVLLHRVVVGSGPDAMAVDGRAGHVFVVNTGSGTVSELDAVSGSVVRTIAVGESLMRIAVDAATNHVFVTNIIGRSVFMFDARNGRMLGTSVINGTPQDIVVDTRSRHVFVLTQGADPAGPGSVTMLNATTGRPLHTTPVGIAPTVLAVDERLGIVIVATVGRLGRDGNPIDRGHAYVLDTRSGQVMQTVTVGVAPFAVAIDERSHRAFVVNAGGRLSTPDSWEWVPRPLRRVLAFIPQPSSRWVTGSVSIFDLPHGAS